MPAPDSIAHFKILEPLGSGGIGEVYRARDTRLGRTVAVKVLSREILSDPAKFDALSVMADRLTRLSHPNIAMLFEGGQDGDRYYMVFEFVQGQPLASLINGRPLQVRRALEFGINLADALAEAHSNGLVHGDIRPDTIMITPKDRAKFMNFGLAPFTGGGVARVSGGSPYVAPEELAGKSADARSDIYSLGAVMFEMFTGRQRARGLVLSGLSPNIPPELEQIIARMLAANVDSRAQSAATVAADLRSVAAILDSRTEAAEAAGAVEPRRRRSGSGRGIAVLITLLVLAGLIIAWFMVRSG
jgi:serine/threonine protein kinase